MTDAERQAALRHAEELLRRHEIGLRKALARVAALKAEQAKQATPGGRTVGRK